MVVLRDAGLEKIRAVLGARGFKQVGGVKTFSFRQAWREGGWFKDHPDKVRRGWSYLTLQDRGFKELFFRRLFEGATRFLPQEVDRGKLAERLASLDRSELERILHHEKNVNGFLLAADRFANKSFANVLREAVESTKNIKTKHTIVSMLLNAIQAINPGLLHPTYAPPVASHVARVVEKARVEPGKQASQQQLAEVGQAFAKLAQSGEVLKPENGVKYVEQVEEVAEKLLRNGVIPGVRVKEVEDLINAKVREALAEQRIKDLISRTQTDLEEMLERRRTTPEQAVRKIIEALREVRRDEPQQADRVITELRKVVARRLHSEEEQNEFNRMIEALLKGLPEEEIVAPARPHRVPRTYEDLLKAVEDGVPSERIEELVKGAALPPGVEADKLVEKAALQNVLDKAEEFLINVKGKRVKRPLTPNEQDEVIKLLAAKKVGHRLLPDAIHEIIRTLVEKGFLKTEDLVSTPQRRSFVDRLEQRVVDERIVSGLRNMCAQKLADIHRMIKGGVPVRQIVDEFERFAVGTSGLQPHLRVEPVRELANEVAKALGPESADFLDGVKETLEGVGKPGWVPRAPPAEGEGMLAGLPEATLRILFPTTYADKPVIEILPVEEEVLKIAASRESAEEKAQRISKVVENALRRGTLPDISSITRLVEWRYPALSLHLAKELDEMQRRLLREITGGEGAAGGE